MAMREILFRGKRTDNGEWVYGYYACIGKHHYILTGKLNLIGAVNFEHYLVIPETVGQYTGMKDKNGKKIFEGDIVRERGGGSCQVFFEIDNVLIVEIPNTLVSFKIGRDCGCEYKVIGNIHDKKLEDFENGC